MINLIHSTLTIKVKYGENSHCSLCPSCLFFSSQTKQICFGLSLEVLVQKCLLKVYSYMCFIFVK